MVSFSLSMFNETSTKMKVMTIFNDKTLHFIGFCPNFEVGVVRMQKMLWTNYDRNLKNRKLGNKNSSSESETELGLTIDWEK